MKTIFLIIIAILPSVVLGTIIYKQDRFGKEPMYLLLILLLSGILAVLLTLVISSVISFIPFFTDDKLMTNILGVVILSFFKISLIEEFSKWLYLYILTWTHDEFNHIYDAIVYSVFVSLGFATVENIVYVLSSGIEVGILRAVLSVPGQVFYGVIMGYYLGLAKFYSINDDKKKNKQNFILSLVIPVILHGIFDFLLLIGTKISMIVFIIFVISLYIYSIKKIKRLSKVNKNLI